jgi:hypothetical protein
MSRPVAWNVDKVKDKEMNNDRAFEPLFLNIKKRDAFLY